MACCFWCLVPWLPFFIGMRNAPDPLGRRIGKS
jgi:hypothetical protein